MKYFGETEQDRVGAVGDDESCFLAAKYLTSISSALWGEIIRQIAAVEQEFASARYRYE